MIKESGSIFLKFISTRVGQKVMNTKVQNAKSSFQHSLFPSQSLKYKDWSKSNVFPSLITTNLIAEEHKVCQNETSIRIPNLVINVVSFLFNHGGHIYLSY